MRRRVSVLAVFLLVACSAWSQTVLQRARLGHVIEDLDTYEKRLVALDGQEVFVANAKGGFEKVFDVRSGGATHCTGIAYVPSEKTFLVMDPSTPFQFYTWDEKGAFLGTRPITYLGGFTPAHAEALTYLGKDTPYPDHIAFLAYNPSSTPYLEVAKRDGTVVLHQPLPAVFINNTFGIASAGGNLLYIMTASSDIYTMDFAGNLVGSPVHVYEGFAFEGITRVGDRVYVRDYFSGKFVAFDTSLQRQPADDLRHDFGLGLGGLAGVTWNSDTHRFILVASNAEALTQVGWELVAALDEIRPRFYPNAHAFQRARGVSWMADEQKIAVAHTQPQRRILIYSPDGALLEQIDVTPSGRPSHVAWNPATNEFFVRVVEFPTKIRVLSRTGAFVRDIDLTALGGSIAAFTLSGSDLLVFAGGLLHRTDLNGNLLASYDYSALGVVPTAIAAISSGPYAGKLAVSSARNCELVVFSLP